MRHLTLLAATAFALAAAAASAQTPIPEEAGVLEPAVPAADADKDGSLDYDIIGRPKHAGVMDSVVTAVDADQDGGVDYHEYDNWLRQRAGSDVEKMDWIPAYNAAMTAFSKADKDLDGKLDATEAAALVTPCVLESCPTQ